MERKDEGRRERRRKEKGYRRRERSRRDGLRAGLHVKHHHRITGIGDVAYRVDTTTFGWTGLSCNTLPLVSIFWGKA